MRTITVISRMCGAGKTTLALHIAVAAEAAGYSTDVHSVATATNLTKFAGRPAFTIFNAGPVNAAKLYAETAEAVTEIGSHQSACWLC